MNTRELFLRYVAQTNPEPLLMEAERAEGVFQFDSKGKKYLDLISGISVSNVGHRHPKVVEAIKQQVDKYMHVMVYGEFIVTPQAKLAEGLRKVLPNEIDNIYFVNSGTEAIEGAIKLARRATGRKELVACHKSYHGASTGTLALSSDEDFKAKFGPYFPGVKHIYHGVEANLCKINEDTAAIIIEPTQGEAGIRQACPTYLKALRKKCNETGALLIFDEIQTGFGRTGTFWAFEQAGIIPDILVAAKGMGGGMPIGAFMANRQLMSLLMKEPILGHITTFGGHPVSCAASLATLKVILEEKLLENIAEKSALFDQLLFLPGVKNVRRHGLLCAVELGSFEKVQALINNLFAKGIISDWFLYCNTAIRLAPPLTITTQELQEGIDTIKKSIYEIMA